MPLPMTDDILMPLGPALKHQFYTLSGRHLDGHDAYFLFWNMLEPPGFMINTLWRVTCKTQDKAYHEWLCPTCLHGFPTVNRWFESLLVLRFAGYALVLTQIASSQSCGGSPGLCHGLVSIYLSLLGSKPALKSDILIFIPIWQRRWFSQPVSSVVM